MIYKIKSKLLSVIISLITILFTHTNIELNATEIKNIAIVNNTTITNIDLEKEIEIVKILNDQKNFTYNEISNAALNNLIDEILKREEINKNKIYINLNNLNKDFNDFVNRKKNNKLKNDPFGKILYNKIKTDYEWNALIMRDFKNNIDINMDEIDKKISQLNFTKEVIDIEREKMINQEKNKKMSIYSKFILNKLKNKSLIKIY